MGNITMFMEVALEFCQFGNPSRAVEVLKDMTELGHQPTYQDVHRLFQYCLMRGDARVLRVIAKWYLENFEESLLRGELKRMIHIASAMGDNELAAIALQVIKNYARSPICTSCLCLTFMNLR